VRSQKSLEKGERERERERERDEMHLSEKVKYSVEKERAY
jgi:hypothetical protein